MIMRCAIRALAVGALWAGPGLTAAAQPSVTVNMAGASIPSTGSMPPDVVRNSAPATISAAPGYLYTFNPNVRTTGLLGLLLFPISTPLGDVFNYFEPGMYRTVIGASRNPPAALPASVLRASFGGVTGGLTLNLTFTLDILPTGVAQAAVRNIQKPSGLGLDVVTGGATLQTFTPPPATRSEWHFDGDLRSVRQSGLAPGAGPGKLRYLDDAAFGPILGGPGEEDIYPAPPTPQNVTQAQSAFVEADGSVVPTIGGTRDTVYRTSPTRNLTDPTNRAKSRGIGLGLFPNTRTYWPDDKLGAWTMIWDLYIPASSWSAEFPVALLEDNHNNDNSADMFIRQAGGVGSVGYQTPFSAYVASTALQPERWLRLALVSDGFGSSLGRLFIDGVFIGVTEGDWVYASTNSLDPRFGDVSSTSALGTPVPSATWAAWGEFPSPWALPRPAPTGTNTNNNAPMASTICLFADLQGRGESVYIANLGFTDEALSDAQIAALGPASARGIWFLKPPACCVDFNNDMEIDFSDIEGFLNALGAMIPGNCAPGADFNNDGEFDFSDIEGFLALYNAGC